MLKIEWVLGVDYITQYTYAEPGVLKINLDKWLKMTPEAQANILKHEQAHRAVWQKNVVNIPVAKLDPADARGLPVVEERQLEHDLKEWIEAAPLPFQKVDVRALREAYNMIVDRQKNEKAVNYRPLRRIEW